MDYGSLLGLAIEKRKAAYAPYSHFTVGAALLCSDGSVYTGCNIENAAFSPTVCAERIAFFNAISDGKRAFTSIAVAGGKEDCAPEADVAPCGVCRQVMMEFCGGKAFDIVIGDSAENPKVYQLKDILPLGFGPRNLGMY